MSNYKIIDADQLETDLGAVADAIRAKGGTTAKLSFPEGFEAAVEAISGAAPEVVAQATPSITVSSSGLVTATVTQTEGFVEGGTTTATKQLSTRAGTTITPGTSPKLAASSNVYTTGTVYVQGDADLVAGNIKSGVSIFGVTGTYTGSSGSSDSTDVDAVLARTISGGYSNDTVTEIGTYAFRGCTGMTAISLPNVKKIGTYAFYECSSLSQVNIPSVTALNASSFYKCTSLTSVKLPALIQLAGSTFKYCSNLETLILGRTASCVLLTAATAFDNTKIAEGTGYIYVPSALVEDYKTSTNWTTYADQIRAIEDYPDITGG